METANTVKVKYDTETKRVDVTCGDRRVTIAGRFETLEEARKAAEAYAKRWLMKK